MIQSFIDSWHLFAPTYITGWLIGVTLSMVGVIVVARDQIFIGAAVTQSSMLGIALAMTLGAAAGVSEEHWVNSTGFTQFMAVAFSIAAATFISQVTQRGKDSHEAITGWIFLAASALAILLVTHSPHGMVEVQRLVSSSMIGAGWEDAITFALLAILTAAALCIAMRRILLIVMDPTTAAALGLSVSAWNLSIATWLGLTLGLSLRSSGMLYAFGCLILPALIARHLCRRIRSIFILAPIIVFISGALAFMLANHYDLPPAQATVGLLSAWLPVAWAYRKLLPHV